MAMFQNMDIICNRGNSGHNDPLHVMFWGCVRVSMVFTCGEELAHSTTQSVWAHELRLNFVKINSRAWIFAQYQSDWSSYQSPHYFDCCKPNCSMPCTYVLERDVLTDQWLSEISSIGCLLAYKEFRALVYVWGLGATSVGRHIMYYYSIQVGPVAWVMVSFMADTIQ